jgi:hemerythrin-like domain-containing protein
MDRTRRTFMLGTGALLGACATGARSPSDEHEKAEEANPVAPPEDLMREHGGLDRILLVYEEGIRRLESKQPLELAVIAASADLVRRFIEQYHEKLEEDFLFPRFEKARKLVDLVTTLRAQHAAGRALTDSITRYSTAQSSSDPLVAALRAFVRMYRPHEAREETVLFPAFRDVVSPKEFRELGEHFEDKEHQLFGKEGFEGIVVQIAELEKKLGIHELAQFTPT